LKHLVRKVILSAKKRLAERYGTRKPSRRQLQVIELVTQGLKNREIAVELGIGEHVVRNYLATIYDKIGVSNRVELALWYEARTYESRRAKSR
jgi:DNA-binding NarL/FixJ family response regulator